MMVIEFLTLCLKSFPLFKHYLQFLLHIIIAQHFQIYEFVVFLLTINCLLTDVSNLSCNCLTKVVQKSTFTLYLQNQVDLYS